MKESMSFASYEQLNFKSRKIIGFVVDADIGLEYCAPVRIGRALGARRAGDSGLEHLEFAASDWRKMIGKFSHCASVA
jgi:hypothetical protein